MLVVLIFQFGLLFRVLDGRGKALRPRALRKWKGFPFLRATFLAST